MGGVRQCRTKEPPARSHNALPRCCWHAGFIHALPTYTHPLSSQYSTHQTRYKTCSPPLPLASWSQNAPTLTAHQGWKVCVCVCAREGGYSGLCVYFVLQAGHVAGLQKMHVEKQHESRGSNNARTLQQQQRCPNTSSHLQYASAVP